MFRRPLAHYGLSPQPETPYQKAGQVWDERIGSARVQARNWRLMALAMLGLTAVLTGGLLYQSARGTIMPWVVEVDRLGHVKDVGPADRAWRPTDPQIAFHLAQFISDVRSISADPVVLRQQWLRAYDFATAQGAAALNDYARADDPFAKLQKFQVAVDIASVVRASPDSFRIAWTERRYSSGALSATEHWTAIVSVTLDMPHDPARLRRNPLGVYVTALNWSKEYAP